MATERLECHHLGDIKPLANSVAKLKFLMKKHMFPLEKVHEHNTLKRTPFKTKTLDKMTLFMDSQYAGEWNYLGMAGSGIYKYPDGTIYVGEMEDGLFSGQGSLRFPNAGIIKGTWKRGKLVKGEYIFRDGLKYEPKDWSYCKMPDRRFHSEIVDGLKPSGNIQMASDHPAPYVWPGCFNTVEGFYRPKTKELLHIATGKVIRIVNKPEEDWILNNCQRHGELPFPFNPYIYENWFPVTNKKQYKQKTKSLWETILKTEEIDQLHKPKTLEEKKNILSNTQCFINNKLFP